MTNDDFFTGFYKKNGEEGFTFSGL